MIAADFATWLTAAGTLLSAVAAFMAIWVAIVLPRRHRPKLSIPYPKHPRELVVAQVLLLPTAKTVASAWVRLAVEAEPGRDAAEEVELTILGLRELRARDGFPRSNSDPMLAGLPLAVSSADGKSSANIPAGGFRIFDLASTYNNPAGLAPLAIEVVGFAKPSDKRNELKWGEVEIDLAVTAKNADSRRYRVRIWSDGQWGSDVWEHLKVTALTDLDVRG
jgi:hypothetical protein